MVVDMIQSKNLWINKGQYSDSVNELEKTDLLPITVKVLRNRGIDNINDHDFILNPEHSRLYNPFIKRYR